MGDKILGQRIEQRRKQLGLTLDDIAKEIGVAKSTIQRYEKGTIGTIKLPVIEAIARIMDVDPAWICGKTDIMNGKKTPSGYPFSDILNFLRKREGLSQQELANKLGVARSAISMYETGKREPDFETLKVLADFFNVDMNTLMGWGGDEDTQYITLGRSEDGSSILNLGFLGLKLCSVNCSILIGNKGICFPDGTLSLTEDVLRDLNEDTDSYLRFKLQELRSKYKDNFVPKADSEALPVE